MNAKKIVTKLSVMIMVILLLCDFAIGQMGAFEVVPATGIPEILNTISTCVQENFLQIHSWEGETEVSWYTIYKGDTAKDIFTMHTDAVGEAPNSVVELADSNTTFSCDLDKGFFYTKNRRTTPTRYIDSVSSRDLGTKSIPWWRISILTPEYYLHSGPNRMRDGHVTQRRGIKEKVDQDCSSCAQRSSIFDPRDLFEARTPVWLHYPRIVERIEKNGKYVVDEYALKVEQRELDDKVQYRVHEPAKVGPQGDNIWLIKTYSSDARWNMISSERTRADGELVRRQSLVYQSVQGIFIPSRTTYETFDPNDGSVRNRKERIFKNVRLNGVIRGEMFTYENLDLKNGDKFVDNIQGKEYTYQDGELLQVSNK